MVKFQRSFIVNVCKGWKTIGKVGLGGKPQCCLWMDWKACVAKFASFLSVDLVAPCRRSTPRCHKFSSNILVNLHDETRCAMRNYHHDVLLGELHWVVKRELFGKPVAYQGHILFIVASAVSLSHDHWLQSWMRFRIVQLWARFVIGDGTRL